MKTVVVYIHGAGGSAAEAEHYKGLFPDSEVIGFDYRSQTPWDAITEFQNFFETIMPEYNSAILIANSIGAFYAMHALSSVCFEKTYFISPIVDMEKLITDMMRRAGVTEEELEDKEIIPSFGTILRPYYTEITITCSLLIPYRHLQENAKRR